MAQGVRAGRLIAALELAAGLHLGVLASGGLAGCSHQPTAGEIVQSILDRHHGVLQADMHSAVLELRATEEGPAMTCVIQLPDHLRVNFPDGRIETLVRGQAMRHDPGGKARVLDEAAHLRALRQHLRAILLRPLYLARQIERRGPKTLELRLPDGESWLLKLDAGAKNPASLTGPAGELRFLSFLDTGYTRHARRVRMAGFGMRWVRILDAGFVIDEATFLRPGLTGAQAKTRTPTARSGNADRPASPERQHLAPTHLLVLDDPGDWSGREKLIETQSRTLYQQGQTSDGLPIYTTEEGRARILIPFRPDPERGGAALRPRPGQEVRARPAHDAVVAAPPAGPFGPAIAKARALIATFLAKTGARAMGTLRVIPIGSGGSGGGAQKSFTLRVEQPVQPGKQGR